MSNEYIDWIKEKNQEARALIEKYPFLQIKENGVYPWLEKNGFDATWLDDLPNGWQIGFCEDMCDELMEVLGDYADKWVIVQVKEKFGGLRVYHSGLPDDIYDAVDNIIDKYEELSYKTCSVCGKPATKMSSGWILPYCDKCYEARHK